MPSMPLRILFVHQGYELYGSDRTLIQSVEAVARRWPEAKITILLPSVGDLQSALLSIVDDVRIVNLAILRKASLKSLRLRDIGGFVKRVLEARRMMRAYDVTYINTVLVMDYILAASVVRRPPIIHVHEIPTGAAAPFFSGLVVLSRALTIFNSEATRRGLKLPFWQRGVVVWNGAAPPSQLPSASKHSRLRLLLIGRFNSWKGQEILLRAVASLTADQRSRLSVRLVGSVFGSQEHFVDKLQRVIAEEGLSEIVEMCPFTPNPYEHYSWADVVVVPSIKPEPFGLVAVEAMAAGRTVVAANHGGISEIVVNGATGTLVEPGSIQSLASVISSYMDNPARVIAEGNAGRKRFAAEFDEKYYKMKIGDIIADFSKRQVT
jgi:glycosyltransferase involved in cell wall biosynthesis